MVRVAQYRGLSLISKTIKLTTGGPYSHTAIVLEEDFIVEAWHTTNRVRVVRGFDDGHTPSTPVDIYTVDLTEEEERRFREFVIDQVGKRYDFLGVFGFHLATRLHRRGRWFCSELLGAALAATGNKLYEDLVPSKLSPNGVVGLPGFTKLDPEDKK